MGFKEHIKIYVLFDMITYDRKKNIISNIKFSQFTALVSCKSCLGHSLS